jgi:hypothetical protein
MQHVLTLTAPDGVEVPITIDSREKNTAAVLCLHGFTSSIREHMLFNAAAKFPGQGFDTWRLPFYPGWKGRSMRTIRLEQNLTDIRLALGEMHQRYQNVFIMATPLAEAGGGARRYKISALILIDPPHREDLRSETSTNSIRILFHSMGRLATLSKTLRTDCRVLPYTTIPALPCPTLLMRSSSGTDTWPDHLKCKTKIIRNSDHSFTREGNEKAVFGHALRFMRDHLRASPALPKAPESPILDA